MDLRLSVIGLVVADMATTLAFYRRLGLDLPTDADGQPHVEVQVGGLRLAFDTEEVIRHRLALYYEVTHPILSWYGERGILVSVDANRDADAVGRQILTALEVLRQVVDRDDGTRKAVDLTGLGAAFGARSSG